MANDKQKFEGVLTKNRVELRDKSVDIRPLSVKFKDKLTGSSGLALGILIVIAFVFGFGYDFSLRFMDMGFFILALYLFLIGTLGNSKKLLFRVPMSSATKIVPNFADNKAKYLAANGEEVTGLIYFGQNVEDGFEGEELWLSDDDVRKHMLLFGTTGAGKTEALLSLCYGALITCSGFLFSDGKGTFELYYKVHNTCRKLGQDDDLLLMSFLTGNEDVRKATSQKYSNTINPVAVATQDAAAQLLVSLMASNGGGSGDMWAERAAVLMESVMGLLTWQRDNKKRPISIDSIRDTLVLSNYYEIWHKAQSIDNEDDPNYLPAYVLKSMNGYLVSLPGFLADVPFDKMPPTVAEQHGFLFMQFSKLLGSLADMYGYIFNTQYSEIDFWDVVTNRRVLVVLLPALAKSKQELSMLGKIVIACIKQMMTSGLGKYSEGFAGEMKKENPTVSPTPFLAILDEFGYYAVAGSAVMPAQARSLGFFMIFAGQDFPAFSASGKEEAQAIVANCKLQVCMALQDQGETYAIFRDKAGNADTYVSSGKVYRDGTLQSNDSVSTENKAVITFNDLSRQKSGFAHFLLEGDLARGRFFYAAIPLKDHHPISVNQFVKVAPPTVEASAALNRSLDNVYKLITNIQYQESCKHEYSDTNAGKEMQELASLLAMYKKRFEQARVPLLETCATVAHILYNYNKTNQESEMRNASITKNYKRNQAEYIKDDASYQAEIDQFKADKEKAGSKPTRPFGVPASVIREEFNDIASVVSDNANVTRHNTEKTMSNINQTIKYPNKLPQGKDPKSLASLIHEMAERGKNHKNQNNTANE